MPVRGSIEKDSMQINLEESRYTLEECENPIGEPEDAQTR